MFNDIISSGFKVEKVVEPLPLKDMIDIEASTYDRLLKIPAFMIWVLTK